MSTQQTSHSSDNPTLTIHDPVATEHPGVPIHTQESTKLLVYEETIKQTLVEGMFQAGAILRKIRDEKLYHLAHKNFKDYLSVRWGWSYSHIHRIIEGAILFDTVTTSPIGEVVHPTAESQLRPLVILKDPDKQRAAWKLAVEIAGGRVPSAVQVTKALREIGPPPTPGTRRAKSCPSAPALNAKATHDVVGGDDNPPLRSEAEGGRGHAAEGGQDAGEPISPPARFVVRDEDEPSYTPDLLPPKMKSTDANAPEVSVSEDAKNNSLNETDNDSIDRGSILAILEPDPNAPAEVRHIGDTVCEAGNERMHAVADIGDPDETAHSIRAPEKGEGSAGPTILTGSTQSLDMPGDVAQDQAVGDEIALQSSPASGELSCQPEDEPAAPKATHFVLADGSEIVSELIADGEQILPQTVQQALDAMKRKSTASSVTVVAGQQRAVVFLAEHVNQAIKAYGSLNASQVLSSMGSALILWQGLLTKKGSRK